MISLRVICKGQAATPAEFSDRLAGSFWHGRNRGGRVKLQRQKRAREPNNEVGNPHSILVYILTASSRVTLLLLEVAGGDEERRCVDAKRLCPATNNHQVER